MSTDYLNHYIIYFHLFVSMNIFVFVDIQIGGKMRVLLLNYLLRNFFLCNCHFVITQIDCIINIYIIIHTCTETHTLAYSERSYFERVVVYIRSSFNQELNYFNMTIL